MRILITGADGQLGRDLRDCLEETCRSAAPLRAARPQGPRAGVDHEVLATDVHNMKVDDRDAVLHTFAGLPA